MRIEALLPAALILAFPSFSALAANKEKQPAAERAYVETSYLLAPRKVGEFTLDGVHYDGARKYAGADFRYIVEGHQEIRVDVYVYPAGRMDSSTAMTKGMEAFRADMKLAVDAKAYSDLSLNDEQDFLLTEPNQPAINEHAEDANTAALLQALAGANQTGGRKLLMTMNLQPQDWPMYSGGYLFYKQLYFFKVRASAAQERVSTEEFETLADRAARALVPAIEVANVGGCANSTITVDSDASPEEMAKALVTQAVVHGGYNCYATEDDAEIKRKSQDAELVNIAYEPKEWTSE